MQPFRALKRSINLLIARMGQRFLSLLPIFRKVELSCGDSAAWLSMQDWLTPLVGDVTILPAADSAQSFGSSVIYCWYVGKVINSPPSVKKRVRRIANPRSLLGMT